MSPRTIVLIILISLLAITVWWTLTRYFLRRAMITVVMMFRHHRALDDASAKSKEEIGLINPGIRQVERIWDYKPTAFRVLLRSGIIRISKDARRFYLSEKLLSQTDLKVPERDGAG